jgi:ABC-type lipoprotein export system ATPase subunit
MADTLYINNFRGSVWHRWEPHIHTPGTVLNDQYNKGDNAFEEFCNHVIQAVPPIKALGITDYYSLSSYEIALAYKTQGKLNTIDFMFPNIELRFNIGTGKGAAINGHLLVNPDDPNHVNEIKRFLQNLTFTNGEDTFRCQESDLIRLGHIHDKNAGNDKRALEVGTNQFKVEFKQLIEAFRNNAWAQENILLGVAVGKNDGTSGLNNDASFSATRQFIEKMSHIVFSGSDKQREFWLGNGMMSKDKLLETYNGCKPCIHGSDAHALAEVGKPDLDRYTWIKGDLTFETLKQICIEPNDRVFVAAVPPDNRIASNVIETVNIENAYWMQPSAIPLNTGLIAIIGARGSGKTALADLIATGGHAISTQVNKTSFIIRAQEHLDDVSVALSWQAGENTVKAVRDARYDDFYETARVQYLSQQFVDQLCSSEGMTDELLLEIERVIFTAHPIEDRIGISDFQEMLSQRASIARLQRQEQESIISEKSRFITSELTKKNSLPNLQKKRDDLLKEINTDKEARSKLIAKGKDTRIQEFEKISSALEKLTIKIDALAAKQRGLLALRQSVESGRSITFANYTTKLKDAAPSAGLTIEEWASFKLDFVGNVDAILTNKLSETDEQLYRLKGKKNSTNMTETSISFIPLGENLEDQTYETLTRESQRLKQLIGIDTENGRQYARISEKIVKQESELEKLKLDIVDCESAHERMNLQMSLRKIAYQKVFEAILEEETQLTELYEPLMHNLKAQQGTLSKLSFKVTRQANTTQWAERGENLLDLRKSGPFKGKGTLLEIINEELKSVWETGTAEEISVALTSFRDKHEKEIVEHAQADRKNVAEFSSWANQIAEWLYSTDHISISYGVLYDGVQIQQLSPGTRGIVLLLLYLAIDKEDDRPLIIDQPEENLDPKSIFDELVPLFKTVKTRRQVVIVTHNANLVVNTDADQVIIANAGAHQPGKLPAMTYQSGGLENPHIRRQVCEILEGGNAAFRERAKRLRVLL